MNAETRTKSRTAKETITSSTGFQFPQFEIPKLEVPNGFREVVAQWVSQSKDNFEKMIVAAEEINGVFENTCSSAAKGAADYTATLSEAMHNNAAAAFDFVHDIIAAKSRPKMMDISTASARKQFDVLDSRNHELWTLAQQLTTEAIKPMTGGLPKSIQYDAST